MRRASLNPTLIGLFVLAVAALAPSAWTLRQPIVENYVGRQIPTAMVAQNIARGGDLIYPQLDTGPFPSSFLVEPPCYAACVAAVSRATGLPIASAGRLTSTLASMLGAWGLAGLVARRRGREEGWLAAVLLLWLPVTLRYGRAVQPDMLALGLVTSGLNACDRWARGGHSGWLPVGFLLTTFGLATRILWVFTLPILFVLLGARRHRAHAAWRWAFVAAALLPAFVWYLHAWRLVSHSAAARATASDWATALGPLGLLRGETWRWIVHFGVIRAFGPLAWCMVAACLWRGLLDRIWLAWLTCALITLALVSGKLHHEYYWLMAAPAIAAGMARWIARAFEAARWEGQLAWAGLGLLAAQGGLSVALAFSTWHTPPEWVRVNDLPRAAASLPANTLMIGREAVLYYADRRGMRLESDPEAIQRALAEWGVSVTLEEATPRVALRWYHDLGARAFADVDDPAAGPLRSAWARAARAASRRIVADEPGLLVVELKEDLP